MDIVPAKFDTIGTFVDSLALAKFTGKWGFINKQGETKIAFKYSEVHDFCDGMAKVKYAGKYGYIDANGNEIIPVEYQNIYGFNDKMVNVNIVSSYNGDEAVMVDVFEILTFGDGILIFKKDGKWGAMNLNREILIENKYNSIKEVKANLYKQM